MCETRTSTSPYTHVENAKNLLHAFEAAMQADQQTLAESALSKAADQLDKACQVMATRANEDDDAAPYVRPVEF